MTTFCCKLKEEALCNKIETIDLGSGGNSGDDVGFGIYYGFGK